MIVIRYLRYCIYLFLALIIVTAMCAINWVYPEMMDSQEDWY